MYKYQPKIISVTPTVDTAIYASGDHLGTLMTLTGAVDASLIGAVLQSITVTDKASQSSALDILLFNYTPTIASADNAALNISDSEMATKCIGVVNIPSASYKALSANSVVTVSGINLVCQPSKAGVEGAYTNQTSLYALICSRGTPTYTSTSDLTLKFGFTYP